MSVKQNMMAVYTRFPASADEADLPSHFLTLAGEDMFLVVNKDDNFFPFVIDEDALDLPPDQFIAGIIRTAEQAGILDILDGKHD